MDDLKKTSLFFVLLFALTLLIFAGCSFSGEGDGNDVPSTVVFDEPEIPEGRFLFEGIAAELPEGFGVTVIGGVTTAVSKENYPEKGDNIAFFASEDSVENYTKELLVSGMEEMVGEISDVSYEKTSVGGNEAVRFSFAAKKDGETIKQTQFTVFFDESSVSVVFTDVTGEFSQSFEKALKSISVE